jgi:hypothetical protein
MATEALASAIARAVAPGELITLDGELGAGKTTFARAFARTLGVPDGHASSPTFAIVSEYPTPCGRGILHADIYRLDEDDPAPEDILAILDGADPPYALVEWSDRSELLPEAAALRILILHHDEQTRRFLLTANPGLRPRLTRVLTQAGLIEPSA